jgi:hypothetical protein
MLHHFLTDNTPWFAAKRFGYGAGLPIVWQGWVLLLTHLALIIGVTLALAPYGPVALTMVALILGIAPLPIYARHTQGGWRWRNGGD